MIACSIMDFVATWASSSLPPDHPNKQDLAIPQDNNAF